MCGYNDLWSVYFTSPNTDKGTFVIRMCKLLELLPRDVLAIHNTHNDGSIALVRDNRDYEK